MGIRNHPAGPVEPRESGYQPRIQSGSSAGTPKVCACNPYDFEVTLQQSVARLRWP